MKKLLLLLVFIMFNCDAEDVADLAHELTKNEKYQIGLSLACSENSTKTWYCISKTEFDRLKALTRSCESITITSSGGNNYSGIIAGNSSFRKSESPCSN
ncbi:hypothetical protein [Aestuariivivens sediminicola]|uniref:hypothetical protein n=1 Tax=Aestuariivivens sediminicola TaxID=2913560 RepID=UPI001F5A9687|nr:hypothetical protein [Aestuariivivens sediminicola]